MIYKNSIAVCLFCVALLFAGCDVKKDAPSQSDSSTATSTENKPHEHGDADVLVWAKKDIEQDGYLISLGPSRQSFSYWRFN